MARLSELVDVVTEITGIPRNNVGLHARLAREAGFIGQGGRGFSAPAMTPRDAAMLIGAIVASPTAKETAQTLKRLTEKNSRIIRFDDEMFVAGCDLSSTPPHIKYIIPTINTKIQAEDRIMSESSLDASIPEALIFAIKKHSCIEALEHIIANANSISPAFDCRDSFTVTFGCDINPTIAIRQIEQDPTGDLFIELKYGNIKNKKREDFHVFKYVTWETVRAVSRIL